MNTGSGRREAVGVRVHDDLGAVSRAAADAFVVAAEAAVAARGRFVVALAGGETPRALYHDLAARYGAREFWKATDVYFGDERCVPPDDAASNFRMAQDALLSRVAVAPARVHRMRGEVQPAAAVAAAYDALLRRELAGDATLDLALLGVGADGHTASLFPHDRDALDERERWALAVHAPPGYAPAERITLTLPALNRARAVWVLAAGAGKAAAVRRSLEVDAGDVMPPAGLVRGTDETVWFLDRAAAEGLRAR